MISPMKKVTLLALASDVDRTVSALRDAGVMHVTSSPAQSPSSPSTASEELLQSLGKARRTLADFAPASSPDPEAASASPDALASLVLRLARQREEADATAARLAREMEAQAPFGDFNPDTVRAFAERGIPVTLFRLPAKQPFPADDGLHRLGTANGYVYGAAIGRALPDGVDGLEPCALPKRSLGALAAERDAAVAESAAMASRLASAARELPRIDAASAVLEEQAAFQRVGESMAAHGPLVSLDGYCPADRIDALQTAARDDGWALWIRDPDADDAPPVSLRLPRWLRPIQLLFTGLGILPGYREADVSAVFLLFFSLFFAMLVGDAGYGALMLLAVVAARLKFRKASPQPFWLFGTFAVATVVWGALAGSWFAIDHKYLPRFMQGVPWIASVDARDDNVMWLCFLVGGIHLTIAHLWNAIVLAPSRKALAQIGWIGVVWLMFHVAGMLVVGKAMPACVPWIGGAGVVLIALFMTDPKDFKTEWINHPMLVLNLISCLVDVISYIRLFAVGMASAQIAMNFNQMAMGLPLPVWIKPLGVVLILVLGHGLNLILAALSILVHAVRLNTLEFSNHKGLTWSGQPYAPFTKKEKAKEA